MPQDYIRGKVLLVCWSVDPTLPSPESAAQVGVQKAVWQSASASFSRTRWDRTFHVIRQEPVRANESAPQRVYHESLRVGFVSPGIRF